jgi:hypothetical protein
MQRLFAGKDEVRNSSASTRGSSLMFGNGSQMSWRAAAEEAVEEGRGAVEGWVRFPCPFLLALLVVRFVLMLTLPRHAQAV